MENDLDDLLFAFLDHMDELRGADYFIPGSTQKYHSLLNRFMEKYNE